MRRALVILLIGSIAVNAAAGIYALLAGELGSLEGKILFTSLTVSGAGVIVLACLPALERRRLGVLPRVGVAATVAGSGMLIAVIWIEDPPGPIWKTAATLLVVAAAAAYGSLVSLARVASRYRWAPLCAVGLSLALGGLVVSGVWGEWEGDWYGRSLGVVAVLLAALTLALPVLHRVSRGELAPSAEREPGVEVRFCPRCGRPVSGVLAEETTCPSCGLRFTVLSGPPATLGEEIEEASRRGG